MRQRIEFFLLPVSGSRASVEQAARNTVQFLLSRMRSGRFQAVIDFSV